MKFTFISKMSAKEKWMLFLLAGLLLAVIFFPAGKKESSSLLKETKENKDIDNGSFSSLQNFGTGENMSVSQYEQYLSARLETILSEIDGAGKVQAWVTLSASSEKIVYEKADSENELLEEADSVGGKRKEEHRKEERAVITDSGGNPYVIKTLQPEVEGVLVVAEGAGNSVIKKNISEAVEVLFGIDAHRIKVAKKKVEE